MAEPLPTELQQLDDALGAVERDARSLVDGLTEARGTWRPEPGSWSVAECLDHLATANRVYLEAMRPSATRARSTGRKRRRTARPGPLGQWFVNFLEPSQTTRRKTKAPRVIRPRMAPPLNDAYAAFMASHEDARNFLRTYADVDLAGVRFPNPFISVIQFSLATGLHVIAAHERRHLVQAWRVRRQAEQAAAP
jgi:hypothetical protein